MRTAQLDLQPSEEVSMEDQDEEIGDRKALLESILAERREKNLILNPRQYQSQLYEKAKTQNVIACLGTGSGKTLIGVLLLKHMFNKEVALLEADEGRGKRRRISLFLVNKIPLVRQQAQVIMNNSFLRVAEVFGDCSLGQDLLTEAAWENLFRGDKYDVIVSTAQVVLDALIHAFIRIEEINLIIFDEAHHAHKQDSYARIMLNHYMQAPPESRPKIFGMTASPMKADGEYHLAVQELERTLDAKIFTASLGLRKEMETIVSPPEEHLIEYSPTTQIQEGALTQLIKARCGHLDEIEKPLNRMKFNDLEYGSLVSDLAWLGNSEELEGRMHRKLQQAGAQEPNCDLLRPDWIRTVAMEQMLASTTDETEMRRKIKYVHDAAVNSAIWEVVRTYPPISDIVTVDATNATPKILKLIKVLELCGSTPVLQKVFCCIMFVKRQQTAIALTELLKRVDSLQSWLRPEWVTGHNADYGSGMDVKKQAQTLSRFGKHGSTNLLIATTVAEEGLDISPCNYVIRFDLFDHHVGYLQSKGRARHRNSLFIVLVEEGNRKHYLTIQKVNIVDGEIDYWLRNLPEEQGAIASMDSAESSEEEGEEEEGDKGQDDYDLTLTSVVTGACLRPIDCVSIVCYYVSSLARDEFQPQKPEFYLMEGDCGFLVELRFPANAKVRFVKGSWCFSKTRAARMACFEACRLLYELKELDEHLLPRGVKKAKKLPPVAQFKRGLDAQSHEVKRKIPTVYDSGIPKEKDIVGTLTLHGIAIDTTDAFPERTSRSILLLLPLETSALPSVDLYIKEPCTIPATTSSVKVYLDEKQAKEACRYSFELLCLIGRQEWKGDRLPYLILPMTGCSAGSSINASTIDWQEVRRPLSSLAIKLEEYLSSLQDLKTAALEDLSLCQGREAYNEAIYEATCIRDDLNPFTVCDTRPNIPEDQRDTYFSNLVKRRKFLKEAEEPPQGQPLIEAVKVSREGSLLGNLDLLKNRSRVGFLIPSFTYVVLCSASFFRSCTLLPSIMERYDQVFLARDLKRELLGDCVEEEHLIEALTLSRTGQIFNYQKLEYHGDCYLKLLTTTWAFSKCDSHRESDLHLESRNILTNTALLKVTMSKGLAEFAASRRITVRTWSPPLLSSSREDKFSEKTLSDLVESILGAAWTSSQDPMDLSKVSDCAMRLGLLGIGVPTDLPNFQGIFDKQVKPKEEVELWRDRVEVGTLQRLQDELGYIFRSPHLALEAVTHSSTLDSVLPSYERLEFLGDAVLDLFVVSLFKEKFPQLEAGEATMVKADAVCNISLAVLCVELGLQRYLMHSNKSLALTIATFQDDLRLAKEKKEEAMQQGGEARPYWHHLKPPKVLADIVESMLGAIFVDSGFNIHTTKAFFDRAYLSHFQTYFRPEASLVRTSYQFLQFIKQHECIEWNIQVEDLQEKGIRCRLIFHGFIIAIQKSMASKAKLILEYKQHWDEYRNRARQQKLSMDQMDGRGLKALFQTCLPGNFVCDSEQMKVDEDVDLKIRNQYANLHTLCNCRRVRLEQEQEDE